MGRIQARQGGRRGRPTADGSATIYGWGPGVHIAWSAGVWRGDQRLVAEAQRLCERREVLPVPGTGGYAIASAVNPLGVVAVIAAVTAPDGTIAGDVPIDEVLRLRETSLRDPDGAS